MGNLCAFLYIAKSFYLKEDKTMKKKIIAMLTAVMVMGALAGCGGSAAPKESTPAESKTESTVSEETTAGERAAETTTEGKGTM